jgi:uncharacterized protein YlzI (FlbEa/FlbD family)
LEGQGSELEIAGKKIRVAERRDGNVEYVLNKVREARKQARSFLTTS